MCFHTVPLRLSVAPGNGLGNVSSRLQVLFASGKSSTWNENALRQEYFSAHQEGFAGQSSSRFFSDFSKGIPPLLILLLIRHGSGVNDEQHDPFPSYTQPSILASTDSLAGHGADGGSSNGSCSTWSGQAIERIRTCTDGHPC